MKKYLVYLNVLSALAVVFLHTNFVYWNFSTQHYWITANVIESIFYFAVPIFAMITGANVIGYSEKYTLTTYINKRIDKVMVPFLIWTLIAYIFRHKVVIFRWEWLTMHSLPFKWLSLMVVWSIVYLLTTLYIKNTLYHCILKMIHWVMLIITVVKLTTPNGIAVTAILQNIWHTNYWGIYWYFIALFSIYIAIPAFESIPKINRQKTFQYFILTTFIFGFLLAFMMQVFPNLSPNGNLTMPIHSYIWFALTGYYIDNYPITKVYRYIIYLLGVVGFSLLLFGTQLLSFQHNAYMSLFKGYLNVPAILYAVAIFTFFKYLSPKWYDGKLFYIAKQIFPTTFGIYLVHEFFVVYIQNYFKFNFYSMTVRIILTFVVFTLSVLSVRSYQLMYKLFKNKFHTKNKGV